MVSITLLKSYFAQYLVCSVKLHFFAEFRSVPFRASELAFPRNSECLGMSTFFRGITETIPSLFRGIFSERNSVPNPTRNKGGGTHSPGGEGDGGSIFWKTRVIGLPSYGNICTLWSRVSVVLRIFRLDVSACQFRALSFLSFYRMTIRRVISAGMEQTVWPMLF